MFLFRLVYYSRNQIPSQELSMAKEMRSILDSSLRNNPSAGLTGALIFNDTYFAHVMEGDRKSVTSRFCKVAKDPRHSDLVIVEAKAIDQRMFNEWSMAYAGHSKAIDALYMKHSITIGLKPQAMSAASLINFIADLVASDACVARTSMCDDTAASSNMTKIMAARTVANK